LDEVGVEFAVVDPHVLASLDGESIAAISKHILGDDVADNDIALLPDEQSYTVESYRLSADALKLGVLALLLRTIHTGTWETNDSLVGANSYLLGTRDHA